MTNTLPVSSADMDEKMLSGKVPLERFRSQLRQRLLVKNYNFFEVNGFKTLGSMG